MVGQHPPGLSWGDMGEEHPSHSAVVPCSQPVGAAGEHHQPRNAVEALEEEGNLHHSQAVWESGRYHPLRIVGEEL